MILRETSDLGISTLSWAETPTLQKREIIFESICMEQLPKRIQDVFDFAREMTDTEAEATAVLVSLLDLSANRQELQTSYSQWFRDKQKKEKEKK